MTANPAPATVTELLDRIAADDPHRAFLRFAGEVTSYAQFALSTRRTASALRELGVQPGDRVAIMSGNRPEFLEAWFAATRVGAVEVPVNAALRGQFLAYPVADCGARVLLVEAELLPHVEAVRDRLPDLVTVIVVGAGPDEALPAGVERFEELRDAASPSTADHSPSLDDISVIGYTSGTTGPSKGVMLSHRAAWHAGNDARRYRGLTDGDVFSTTLPLFHLNAQHLTTVAVLIAGATLALERRFSATTFWRELQESRATHVNLIGAMLGILAQRPASDEERSDIPRIAFAGPLSPIAVAAGRDRWNMRFLTGYGATESGIVTYHWADGLPDGSFGTAIPEFDIQLVDDAGDPVPVGEAGEIVTRPTRAGSMMSGYFGKPEKTVEAWRDLWFHSGDMARQDAQGFYYFVDRKKDALRRRGENISSTELEAALAQHPAVAEAAVIAVPSELGEDDVMAVVRLRDGADFRPDAFLEWCEAELPRYMVPRYVDVVDEFPRTPTQRIEKYRLREAGPTPSTWDRETHAYRIGAAV